jgi:hypothetical protein
VTSEAAPPSTDQIKADLREEFPGWNIIRSDRGRWWATRGPLTRECLNRVSDVDADTPEGLRDRIREATRGE